MRSTYLHSQLTFVGAILLAILVVVGPATPARSHVEPTTPTGEAGRRADVGFVPTHGCGSAATVGIDIQLPEGVLDPLATDLDGWTASVDDRVVTWDGGPLPDGDDATFSVNVLLPDTPGTTLFFPTIQRCPDGQSLAWIQQPDDGTDQSYPAPAITVVRAAGPPGTTRAAPSTTSGPASAADQVVPPTTAAPTTSVATTSTTVPQASLVEGESDSGGDSLRPILLVLGGVIVVAAGAIVVLRRRSGG